MDSLLPASVARLEQLPRELRIRPMARYFFDRWGILANGQARVAIGVLCEREWKPAEKNDPMQKTARALLKAGARPVPIYWGGGSPEEQLGQVQGLLLPGGADIDPALYDQEIRGATDTSGMDPENDRFHLECVRLATRRQMPMLGICRGAQMLNVAAGGTLRQQLPSDHEQQNPTSQPGHPVQVEPGSEMERADGGGHEVNSRHHHASGLVGEGFRVTARASDGVIECIEREHPWAVGTEFHPESQRQTDEKKENFFVRLVQEAEKYADANLTQPLPGSNPR